MNVPHVGKIFAMTSENQKIFRLFLTNEQKTESKQRLLKHRVSY